MVGPASEHGWKKLYDRVPEHEVSVKSHRQNHVEWCEVERQLTGNVGIDMQLNSEILSQKRM